MAALEAVGADFRKSWPWFLRGTHHSGAQLPQRSYLSAPVTIRIVAMVELLSPILFMKCFEAVLVPFLPLLQAQGQAWSTAHLLPEDTGRPSLQTRLLGESRLGLEHNKMWGISGWTSAPGSTLRASLAPAPPLARLAL